MPYNKFGDYCKIVCACLIWIGPSALNLRQFSLHARKMALKCLGILFHFPFSFKAVGCSLECCHEWIELHNQ